MIGRICYRVKHFLFKRFILLYNYLSGSSSVGRASAFQAECREFDPRLPLQTNIMKLQTPSMTSLSQKFKSRIIRCEQCRTQLRVPIKFNKIIRIRCPKCKTQYEINMKFDAAAIKQRWNTLSTFQKYAFLIAVALSGYVFFFHQSPPPTADIDSLGIR